jgi:hypothetical protein
MRPLRSTETFAGFHVQAYFFEVAAIILVTVGNQHSKCSCRCETVVS